MHPPARTRLFAIGAILVAAVAFGMIAAGGIGKNLVYYWGPTELHAAGEGRAGLPAGGGSAACGKPPSSTVHSPPRMAATSGWSAGIGAVPAGMLREPAHS